MTHCSDPDRSWRRHVEQRLVSGFGRQALQPPSQGGPPRGEVNDTRSHTTRRQNQVVYRFDAMQRRARSLDQALYFPSA